MENKEVPRNQNEESTGSNQNIRHKEKRRTESLNKAFSELRKCIPNVPCDTKLSKIKTLNLASSYIAYLSDILENPISGDEQGGKEFNINFKARISGRARKNRMNFSPKIKDLKSSAQISTADGSGYVSNDLSGQNLKRGKGRTGWPEAVWAEALENGSKSSDCKTEHYLTTNPANNSRNPFLPPVQTPIHQHDMDISGLRSFYGEVELLLNRPEYFPINMEKEQVMHTAEMKFSNEPEYPFTGPALSNGNETFEFRSFSQFDISPPPQDSSTTLGPDLTHNTTVPFPAPPFQSNGVSGPLPSISTLCYSDKSRNSQDSLPQLFAGGSGLIDLDENGFETSCLQTGETDEPNLIELQPVIRFSGKYAELC